MIDVKLSVTEFIQAMEIAKLRFVMSEASSLNHASTYRRDWSTRMSQEIVGACGEIALGKASGSWFVPSVNTFHRVPDCFGDVEVRATDRPDGSLIVRDNDHDDRRYVLAIVSAPEVSLVGWMRGGDCKRPEFIRNPNGYRESWFVPQSELLDMSVFLGGESERTMSGEAAKQ